MKTAEDAEDGSYDSRLFRFAPLGFAQDDRQGEGTIATAYETI